MAENSESQERTERPTPKRLQDARKKGDVPRSRELNTAAGMFAAIAGLVAIGPGAAQSYQAFVVGQFSIERDVLLSDVVIINHLSGAIINAIELLSPFLLLMFVVTLCTPVMMGGWVFSLSSLRLDWGKTNPLKGLKRTFGVQGLIELLKAVLKFVLLGGVAMLVFKGQINDYLMLGQLDNHVALRKLFSLIFVMLVALLIVLLLLAVMDVPIQWIRYMNKLKMTTQQIKEENKEMAGNPEVKQKIRSMQQTVANRKMLLDVPTADVVIVNPTHYAVALRYTEESDAPEVVAKGVDHMAMRIREIAEKSEIEIFSAPELARAIYNHTKVGDLIPSELYFAVAQVLAYVFQLQKTAFSERRKLRRPTDLYVPRSMRDDMQAGRG